MNVSPASKLLSANKTQESFAYTSGTPKSPYAVPVPARPATPSPETVNHFENLMNGSIRRSQIEQLIAQDETVECTQVDTFMETTQLDSPIAHTAVKVEVLRLAAQDGIKGMAGGTPIFGLGFTQSQNNTEKTRQNDRSGEYPARLECNSIDIDGYDYAPFEFVPPVGRPQDLGPPSEPLRLGMSQSQSQSGCLASPTLPNAEFQPVSDTPPTQEVVGASQKLSVGTSKRVEPESVFCTLRFGFTQSQSQTQFAPAAIRDCSPEELKVVDNVQQQLGLGVTQDAVPSQVYLTEMIVSDMIVSDEIALEAEDTNVAAVRKSCSETINRFERSPSTASNVPSFISPIIPMGSDASSATKAQMQGQSLTYCHSGNGSSAIVRDAVREAMRCIVIDESTRLDDSCKTLHSTELVDADHKDGEDLIIESTAAGAGNHEGWMESRRGAQPIASQSLASLSEDLLNISAVIVPTEDPDKVDPRKLMEELRLAKEMLKQKELEIQALKTEKLNQIVNEALAAPATAIRTPGISSRSDLTPLGAGLGNSRTPATFLEPSPPLASNRSALLLKKKRTGRSPESGSKQKQGNFDFNDSSDESDEASIKESALPKFFSPTHLIAENNTAASLQQHIPSAELSKQSTTNGAEEDDDDDTPMKDVIRQRRKKEKKEKLAAAVAIRQLNVGMTSSAHVSKSSLGGNILLQLGQEPVNAPTEAVPPLPTRNFPKDPLSTIGIAVDRNPKKKYPEDLTHVEEAEWNSQGDLLPPRPRNGQKKIANEVGCSVFSPLPKPNETETAPTLKSPATPNVTSGSAVSRSGNCSSPNILLGLPEELIRTLSAADLPLSLFTIQQYNMKAAVAASSTADLLVLWNRLSFFKVVWKELEKTGWKYTKGRELIDYFYLRPGRSITLGFEERDYFVSQTQVLKYIIQYEMKCMSYFRQVVEKNVHLDETNMECTVFAKGHTVDISTRQDRSHNASEYKKSSLSIDTLMNLVATAKWADLRPILLEAGWTWDYGSGLVSVYYYRPGFTKQDKSAVIGIDKHSEEETVRSYLLLTMSADERSDETEKIISGLREFAAEEGLCEDYANSVDNAEIIQDEFDDDINNEHNFIKDVAPKLIDNASVTSKSSTLETLIDLVGSLKWADLWAVLMKSGWTWDYGSGLVNVWYFRPGFLKQDKSAVVGVDKHSDEDTVRNYIRSQLLMSERSEISNAILDGLRNIAGVVNSTAVSGVIGNKINDDYVWSDEAAISKKDETEANKNNRKRPRRSSKSHKSSKRQHISRDEKDSSADMGMVIADDTQPQHITDYHQYESIVIDNNISSSNRGIFTSRMKHSPVRSPISQKSPTQLPAEASPQKRLFAEHRRGAFDSVTTSFIERKTGIRADLLQSGATAIASTDRSPKLSSRNQQLDNFNRRYVPTKVQTIGDQADGTTPCRYSEMMSATIVESFSKDKKLKKREVFRGIHFIMSGMDTDIRSNISQLIINSGGRILDEISDIENLYGVAARDSEPTVIAIGHPTRFRRVKYLMALAKGIPLVHYSWVYACLCHVQQIISDSMYSNALLPYEGYLLPSGASFLHPYYVFTVKIPDVGPLNGYVVLNLAGDVWDAVLRAAGAEVCSKMYPYGVNAAIQCRIGCTLCPHTARPLKMDSLASAGVPPLRGRTQRMLAMQMLDWYCCTCSDSASPSNRRNGIALGMQYNTSSSTHSRIKPVQSPLVKDYSEQRPDLILFDPYTICAGGHAPTAVGPRHHQPHQAAFTPEQHSLGLKRSTIVSGGSVSMLSPNDHKALSPEADSVLRRLKQLSELRLKFSGVSGGVCPPRIVSIDWVVHVIGLGDFVPFDASRNFSLPADVLRHPIVIKSSGSGDDRYIVDDVVFYDARTTTSCSINPFQIASSRDTAEKGFITRELRMGRILRFDCNECGTVLKLRPLYFQKETIDKAGAIYKDWDDGCGSEGNGSCSESSHNGSSDEDEILSGEDNDDVDRTLKLKRRLFFLKDEFVSKDQLCGRPVVISAAAYNDLIYPQYDETTYASTEFYESCYDGSLYKRSKRLLKKLQCRINADNERYYGKASQDY